MSKKNNETEEVVIKRRSAWTGIMLIVVAAVTLEVTGLIQYYYAQKGIRDEASLRATSVLETTQMQIMDLLNQAEAAVRNGVWDVQFFLQSPDSLESLTRRILEENPIVMGSTVAMVPGYYEDRPLYSPYSCRVPGFDGIATLSLATDEYNYPEQEWFTQALDKDEGYWSEPYVDTGGGELLMVTFSMPVRDESGRVAAILTSDVSLDWMTGQVNDLRIYPNSFSMVLSREGRIMVSPVKSLVMQYTAHDLASGRDSTVMMHVNQRIMSGETGYISVRYQGKKHFVYYTPVERTGWYLSVIIPHEEIFGTIRRIGLLVTLLQLLGLAMLLYILRSYAKNQVRFKALSEKKDRMENELRIGHGIQMSMLPKIFPPFPERKDLDMSATIVTAKEVGGDLYDFFIRDEQLFFCIGDVSGKGVPASLVMAVTSSLFRTMAVHAHSPRGIVTAMNDSMSEMNDNNMFVTFFCGILDLGTGRLRYCNAGHNAPLIFSDKIRSLPVVPNLPLGIMQGFHFEEQEVDMAFDDALFLYTDGLTEAENSRHELFGEARMESVLHTRRDAQGHLDAMRKAVSAFVGDAPQSDDLTMLFLHYLRAESAGEIRSERNLVLHNDIRQVPELESFIDGIAEEGGLDPILANNLNLALEEAVTNVMMYAYPEGTDGLVEIHSILREGSLEFIISDSGKAFDPTAAPRADTSLSAEERPIGGLGIFLVRNIMESVRYERIDDKNVLSMTKKLTKNA